MNEVVLSTGKKIHYILSRRINARSMRVAVFPGGEVRVSAPALLPKIVIDRFLREKSAWIESERARMRDVPKRKTKKEEHADYVSSKVPAQKLIEARLNHFNKHYGYHFERVTIRNQRSRWGSCSRKGNLNFNYRLYFLPPHLADYVIVHELCHLKEFNHSKRFWALVAECIPDYKKLRGRLHDHQGAHNTKTSLM